MCLFKVPQSKKEILQNVSIVAYSLYLVNEEDEFNEFIDEWMKLNPVYAYNHNTDEYMVSYHNWCHMGHVTTLAYQYANHIDLKYYDMVVLFFSTMFHDFAHSFGELNDATNIKNALHEFEKYITHNRFCNTFVNRVFTNLFLKSAFIRDVFETIVCTEYPFVHEAKTPIQMIMRDIDLTMSLSPLELFGEGLTNETKNKFGKLDRKTMAEFALQQNFYYPEIKEEIEKVLKELNEK